MSQMLPSLRMTAAGLQEQLSSLSLAGGMTGVAEAAQLDAMIDAIKVRCKTCLTSEPIREHGGAGGPFEEAPFCLRPWSRDDWAQAAGSYAESA